VERGEWLVGRVRCNNGLENFGDGKRLQKSIEVELEDCIIQK